MKSRASELDLTVIKIVRLTKENLSDRELRKQTKELLQNLVVFAKANQQDAIKSLTKEVETFRLVKNLLK